MLAKLPSEEKVYMMSSKGSRALVETLVKGCLSPEKLALKVGASVMFTKNNMSGGYVNGTLGIVERFDKDSGYPIVKTKEGRAIEVTAMEWSLEENRRVRAKISQLPLRLAWAITVHKSQGLSMDAAAMDLSQVFEFGQGYVALSRVRRLSGLHLFGWNQRAFQVHPEILEQDELFRQSSVVSLEAMRKLSSAEIQKIHEAFLLSSGGRLDAEEIEPPVFVPKVKIDTVEETFKLWNNHLSIPEIATARDLTENTILSHIEKLVGAGKIAQTELRYLLTERLEKSLPQIHAAFAEFSSDKLSPVFAKFQGQYSYDDLRIARIFYKKI